ncbi:ornithine carbamoyltransferase [Candidatus Woesearchaeota archaeon]|nr:ornithine carbamoyltransferase [Candidatus Woesearchaeota archaeon]
MEKDFLTLSSLSREEFIALLDLADDLKKNPKKYSNALQGKTLLMIFEKPSLRTRISFETGMTQLGGHGIYYDLSTSPLGKQKESISDTATTASRYVDIIMARLFSHQHIEEMAKHSRVPVINALTDYSHPCQILADFQAIREAKGKLAGLKLAYLGDGNNNVTHSLIFGAALCGMDIAVASPKGTDYEPQKEVMKKAHDIIKKYGSKSKLILTNEPSEAVKNADIVCTDSWMSYHIPESEKEDRVKKFMPFQVNEKIMKLAKKDAVFIHCLPATRGMEVTANIIDGAQSIVFDEAENRLHTQKALMLKLLKVK